MMCFLHYTYQSMSISLSKYYTVKVFLFLHETPQEPLYSHGHTVHSMTIMRCACCHRIAIVIMNYASSGCGTCPLPPSFFLYCNCAVQDRGNNVGIIN